MRKFLFLILLCTITMCISSCGEYKDWEYLITLDEKSYTLYSDDSATIKGCGLDVAKWSSSNEFVATATADKIESFKVGTATLSYGGQYVRVVVNPRYSLYTEPDMKWGASKSEIISKHGTPYSDNGNTIMYQTNNTDVPLIAYMFNEYGLYASGVVAQISVSSQLLDFLGERYVFYEVNTDTYTANFAHCYGKIDSPQIDYAGQMSYQSSIGGILVVYAANSSTRGIDNSVVFDTIAEAISESI
jgi:hypothetical protein